MGLAEVKTFKSLEDDVISVNRCCACGACIAYCENQAFNVIEMDNYTPKFKTDKSAENCKECGYCYYICPQTEPLLDKLKEAHSVKDELGNIIDIFAARTTDAKIKEIGQDGGIVCPGLCGRGARHGDRHRRHGRAGGRGRPGDGDQHQVPQRA